MARAGRDGGPGDVLLRVSVGRAGDRRYEELDDDELVGRCLAELGPMMGGLGSPTDSLVTRWPLAFPQYAVGHLDLVSRIEAEAAALPAPGPGRRRLPRGGHPGLHRQWPPGGPERPRRPGPRAGGRARRANW